MCTVNAVAALPGRGLAPLGLMTGPPSLGSEFAPLSDVTRRPSTATTTAEKGARQAPG